ncbi:hypothetical protein ANN_08679 [Periplaneta americana]|uniref:Uncharacterized protein n=1 Tax=Periplaneta americana TaxID=6978 RepID=A0ABQ8T3K1_PERAM|nr:hypothetical protein ANN_08679 [Periplaneta americana]
MTGLCEGGNEPPDSLKAIIKKALEKKISKKDNEFVQQKSRGDFSSEKRNLKISRKTKNNSRRENNGEDRETYCLYCVKSYSECAPGDSAWSLSRQTRWATDPELRSGLGWIPLWSLVSSEVSHSLGTEAGWSMASQWRVLGINPFDLITPL